MSNFAPSSTSSVARPVVTPRVVAPPVVAHPERVEPARAVLRELTPFDAVIDRYLPWVVVARVEENMKLLWNEERGAYERNPLGDSEELQGAMLTSRRLEALANLRAEMKAKKYTQRELACHTGKSLSWIGSCLRGDCPFAGAGLLPRGIARHLLSRGYKVPDFLY